MSVFERKKSKISNMSITPIELGTIEMDDRSVACSIDYSNADGFNIR